MNRWSETDPESGLKFTLEEVDKGKFVLNTTYNNIKIDIKHYDFRIGGLKLFHKMLGKAIKDYTKNAKSLRL